MTVRQLYAALETCPNLDAEVTIFFPEDVNPQSKLDYMAHVVEAEFCPRSSISNDELQITCGKRFAY